MSDEPSPGYNESPTPRLGSTGSIATLVGVVVVEVVVGGGVEGAGVSGAAVDGAVDVVDVVVDVVVERSALRMYPPEEPPDEHPAIADPIPTSRISRNRTDPARRTARTVLRDARIEDARLA
jgi:hypothetical protein